MKDTSLPNKIAVIGGDLRQLEAAKAFSELGYEVSVFGIDVVGDKSENARFKRASDLKDALYLADCVILPLPYSYDGEKINAPLSTRPITLSELFAHLSRHQKIAAGLLGASLPEGFSVFDYAASETFAIKNARATVEGALAIAIRESAVTLCHAKVLITGYGRIGKMLANALTALGANVTVIARSARDRAWAWGEGLPAYGFRSLDELCPDCDFLFNTVPTEVIGRSALAAFKKDTVLIELASLPGGIDLRAAGEEGIRVITALGLPGKFSPKTAGRIIAECVKEAFGLTQS